jgi:nitric oxide synthase oxygenase domain/subunit
MEANVKKQLVEIHKEIEKISKAASRLKEISGGIQAIDRNANRILASVKMLGINISDLLKIIP